MRKFAMVAGFGLLAAACGGVTAIVPLFNLRADVVDAALHRSVHHAEAPVVVDLAAGAMHGAEQ